MTMNNNEVTTDRCVVSIPKNTGVLRNKNIRCSRSAIGLAPVVREFGDDEVMLPVCKRHAAVHERGIGLYEYR